MRRPRFEQVVDAGGTVITVAWAGFLGVGLAVAAVGGFAWVITQLTGSTAVLSEVGSPTLDASSSVSDISVPNALAAFWLLVAAAVLLGLAYAASRAIEGLADSPGLRDARSRAAAAAGRHLTRARFAGAVASLVVLWVVRVPLHPLAMLFYQYPLVTWMPVLCAVPVTLVVARHRRRSRFRRRPRSQTGRVLLGVSGFLWLLAMVALSPLQGRALYDATRYAPAVTLPQETQPRILPKLAASAYGARAGMRHAHVTVNPGDGRLVWTAEHKPGLVPRGASDAIGVQPLDRVDGSVERKSGGFAPAVSRIGPGSLAWRAYQRHYFTRVQDPVIVPLAGGDAVAIAPYIGYRGFPVRHPYWKGVYVYHRDGRLEDLTPRQALARPELVHSGRLFPELLARDVAEAYGYRAGVTAGAGDRTRTEIADVAGNTQPYLTDFYDGRVLWVTVAHAAGHDGTLAALFLTDADTGETAVWRAPPSERLLSNAGAAAHVRALPLEWEGCCDDNGDPRAIRTVTEPRPVFARGKLYYLVSVVPINDLTTPQPVDETVLVDAAQRAIVDQYDHADPEADARLRAFFRRTPRPRD